MRGLPESRQLHCQQRDPGRSQGPEGPHSRPQKVALMATLELEGKNCDGLGRPGHLEGARLAKKPQINCQKREAMRNGQQNGHT